MNARGGSRSPLPGVRNRAASEVPRLRRLGAVQHAVSEGDPSQRHSSEEPDRHVSLHLSEATIAGTGFGWSSLAWLRFLAQPTLVIMGTDDPIVPVANGHILAKLIPNAQLMTIDDGHLFLVTSPSETAKIVSNFCQPMSANRRTSGPAFDTSGKI